jgi:hypothetical protein
MSRGLRLADPIGPLAPGARQQIGDSGRGRTASVRTVEFDEAVDHLLVGQAGASQLPRRFKPGH